MPALCGPNAVSGGLKHEAATDAKPAFRRNNRDVEMLVLCGLAVILAFSLQVVSGERVAFRAFANYPLPHTCIPRAWLGLKCPACGLTRGIVQLASGRWTEAQREHRLATLMAIVILIQFPYRTWRLRRPGSSARITRLAGLVGWMVLAALVVNWLVDVLPRR